MLELDHVFAFVGDLSSAATRLTAAGFGLDEGQAHAGQGTRNRRLPLGEQFFELLWLTDPDQARSNALRLDRRAEWLSTGSSPFGLALRGEVPLDDRDRYWLYDELGPRIWVHHDNEQVPERPMVLVFETDEDATSERRSMLRRATTARQNPDLLELRLSSPTVPRLPDAQGPAILQCKGTHHLELVVDPAASSLEISDASVIRG